MVKSRAEIQKAYRQRKLAIEGDEYRKKERARVNAYYKPIDLRTSTEAKERRNNVRTWVRNYRQRKKADNDNMDENIDEVGPDGVQAMSVDVDVDVDVDVHTDGHADVISSSIVSTPMVVKLPFSDPKKRSRRRISRATSKARREIASLMDANESLQTKYKRVSKRYERLVKRSSAELDSLEEMTPRKRAREELRQKGFSPSKIPRSITQKLVLMNVIGDEIKEARKANGNRGNQIVKRVISGRIVKKYRLLTNLGRLSGFNWRTLQSRSKNCSEMPRMGRLLIERVKIQEAVTSFLERDDNSRQLPGKNDVKSVHKEKRQKRVLNDNCSFLHLKFLSENTTFKLSLATFCRLRPKHISLTKFLSRNQCLCQKHQNMALLLKCMKSSGCDVPINPDEYVRKLSDITPTELLNDLDVQQTVIYSKWKRVELPDGKKRTKIVEEEISREKFCEIVSEQSCEFMAHVGRVKDQYKAMTDLKNNLPNKHVIVQMDYAENFSCVSANEVQSAYWNSAAITLHPTVVYYKTDDDEDLKHKTYVFASDDLGHNIGSVYAFLKKLVPILQTDIGPIEWIHYWTDSPSSQYRNKTAFHIVSDHKGLLGVPAQWNYFESGHGKGPCDGVGGTAKRMADLSVRQGKMRIETASDFCEWGRQYHRSATYILVTPEECASARAECVEINSKLVPVKGTMQIHAILPVRPGCIKTRVVSCYCQHCIAGEHHDDWTLATLEKKHTVHADVAVTETEVENTPGSKPVETEVEDVPGNNASQAEVDVTPENNTSEAEDVEDTDARSDELQVVVIRDVQVNQWVGAMYNNNWFVGKVAEVDSKEGDCLVSFLRACYSKASDTSDTVTYKWPNPSDDLWVTFADILCYVDAPIAKGRSGRVYEITSEDSKNISAAFRARC